MNEPTGVGMTAVFVAAARALESEREDRLFDDPWAQSFVQATGWKPPDDDIPGLSREQLIDWVAARTKFLDDFAVESVARGCRQVVFLGAGLDTRALRLPWPEPVTVYELDTAEMFAFKRSVLGDTAPDESVTLVSIPLDLREDWPARLKDNGFRVQVPTAWILEGLLMYLSPEEVDVLMTRVGECSAQASSLGATLTTVDFIASVNALPSVGNSPLSADEWRALLRSNGPEDPVGWLDRYGWDAEAFPLLELARTYGRTSTAAPDQTIAGDRWMVSAVRRAAAGPEPD